MELDLPDGATPLDRDDAACLLPGHITTKGMLNEWEHSNIVRGEAWAFERKRKQIFTLRFLQRLHSKMFGDTWSWAGTFRTKETHPVGVAPEQISGDLFVLLGDVQVQIEYGTWGMKEIAARFHHRLVYIHPFPNGNGRFARTMADLILFTAGHERFSWGAGLEYAGDARARYIAALRAADAKNYLPLFKLLAVPA